MMVWYSYLLDPFGYREDCIRQSKEDLWRAEFPWTALVGPF